MDVRSCPVANIDSDHCLDIARVTACISKVKKITGTARTSKYNVSKVTSSEVAEQIGNK
jgi:hypothetical protein